MTTKLTLSVEEKVIKRAKSFAHKTGRSLSEIVQSYLEDLTTEDKTDSAIPEDLKKIIGVVKLPKNFDEDRERSKYLSKKYS